VPLRAVVFDFDGVIANSEPLHLRAFQDVLASAEITLTDREYYGNYLGFDDAGVFRAVDANRGTHWTATDIDVLVSRKTARLEALEHGMSLLFPGAADAIRRLASTLPLAIASGANGTEIRRVLDREQLTSSFVAIVPADDNLRPKPAPDPYLRAVAQLSAVRGEPLAASDCVAVEDSMWGLRSALTAGLHTVAVTHTYPASELSEADLIIVSLQELTIGRLSALFGA
jgi:beta-phosphoglucomutase